MSFLPEIDQPYFSLNRCREAMDTVKMVFGKNGYGRSHQENAAYEGASIQADNAGGGDADPAFGIPVHTHHAGAAGEPGD